jgi:ArsR family transcriptional regulator
LVPLLKALADESRLKTLWMLEERELCVCEIQEALGLAQSTVSRHLMLLEEVGFVVSAKAGLWKNFRLNPSPHPAAQGLLAVVRLAAQTEPEALALRELVKMICRESLCCPRGT